MSQGLAEPQVTADYITLRIRPAIDLTDDEFFALCQLNRDLRLERTAEGEIIIMPPTGWMTGDRNSEINLQLRKWAKADGTGVVTDSSGGFHLPNGADRAPDAAWVLRSRLAALTAEQKEKFLPLCPDFAIELMSPTDTLAKTQAKMAEYMENGARLGWLINPENRQVHVYRPRRAVVILKNPSDISGDPELPGFVLDLREIWEPNI
jgi:Uma2 family endonuclease